MKSLLEYAERGLTIQRNAERLERQCAWSPFDTLGPENAAASGLYTSTAPERGLVYQIHPQRPHGDTAEKSATDARAPVTPQ